MMRLEISKHFLSWYLIILNRLDKFNLTIHWSESSTFCRNKKCHRDCGQDECISGSQYFGKFRWSLRLDFGKSGAVDNGHNFCLEPDSPMGMHIPGVGVYRTVLSATIVEDHAWNIVDGWECFMRTNLINSRFARNFPTPITETILKKYPIVDMERLVLLDVVTQQWKWIISRKWRWTCAHNEIPGVLNKYMRLFDEDA